MARLLCDSAPGGNRRFSALYARVTAFGQDRTIEEHYQLAKRLKGQPAATAWRKMKGKKPDSIEIAGRPFPAERLSAWYELLWVWYLDDHPELVDFAQQFDEFVDRMAGKSVVNRQDDKIRTYVTKGRDRSLVFCRGLLADLGLSDAVGASRGEAILAGTAAIL